MAAGPVLSLGHAVRRAVLGQGPLKRTSDRLHLLLRLLLVAVLVGAPVVGLAVGTAARERLAASAAGWRAELVQEQAVLLAYAPDAVGEPGTSHVAAAWRAPSGDEVRDRVPAPDGSRAGDRVPVWVTSTGARHAPPPTDRDITLRAASTGVVAGCGTVVLAVVGYLAGVGLLDRARDRRGTAEWAVVELRWRDLPGGPYRR